MNKMQEQLVEFHKVMDLAVGTRPAMLTPELRANLIEEEARETVEAIRRGDMVEAIDGMCDLLYVTFGTAVDFGINLEPFFDEVHRTNMAKVNGPIRASDGKRLKPEGWQPPRIKEMLDNLIHD